MSEVCVDGVLLTPLSVIDTPGGDVMHGMKVHDPGYEGFGEAYFSRIETSVVKGWKRHRRMTLNLMVPIGSIRFVIYDDRVSSATYRVFQEVILSTKNYQRLTVPPMLWMAFQGVGEKTNMLLNIASIWHEPSEADRREIDEIQFPW